MKKQFGPTPTWPYLSFSSLFLLLHHQSPILSPTLPFPQTINYFYILTLSHAVSSETFYLFPLSSNISQTYTYLKEPRSNITSSRNLL